MGYTIRSITGDETSETVAAHVLARAYQAAWRARHGSEPAGALVVPALDLVIDFGGASSSQDGASHTVQ